MPEWLYSDSLVAYPEAISFMEQRVAAIRAGSAPECIWLLEHPSLITAGTSAQPQDLLQADRFPVFAAGRGGQYTYHGPGQRIGYVMLDVRNYGQDVRRFVWLLEEWLIRTFAEFNLVVERRAGRIGLWVSSAESSALRAEAKIAAIGLRLRKWVSYHGFSVNIDPDLNHFDYIRPCGLDCSQYGVTSMLQQGYAISMTDFDVALKRTFPLVFTG